MFMKKRNTSLDISSIDCNVIGEKQIQQPTTQLKSQLKLPSIEHSSMDQLKKKYEFIDEEQVKRKSSQQNILGKILNNQVIQQPTSKTYLSSAQNSLNSTPRQDISQRKNNRYVNSSNDMQQILDSYIGPLQLLYPKQSSVEKKSKMAQKPTFNSVSSKFEQQIEFLRKNSIQNKLNILSQKNTKSKQEHPYMNCNYSSEKLMESKSQIDQSIIQFANQAASKVTKLLNESEKQQNICKGGIDFKCPQLRIISNSIDIQTFQKHLEDLNQSIGTKSSNSLIFKEQQKEHKNEKMSPKLEEEKDTIFKRKKVKQNIDLLNEFKKNARIIKSSIEESYNFQNLDTGKKIAKKQQNSSSLINPFTNNKNSIFLKEQTPSSSLQRNMEQTQKQNENSSQQIPKQQNNHQQQQQQQFPMIIQSNQKKLIEIYDENQNSQMKQLPKVNQNFNKIDLLKILNRAECSLSYHSYRQNNKQSISFVKQPLDLECQQMRIYGTKNELIKQQKVQSSRVDSSNSKKLTFTKFRPWELKQNFSISKNKLQGELKWNNSNNKNFKNINNSSNNKNNNNKETSTVDDLGEQMFSEFDIEDYYDLKCKIQPQNDEKYETKEIDNKY